MKKIFNRKKYIETKCDTNDETFEKWVSNQVLKETEELINGMENGQDLNKFEPTDEIFERIEKEAREPGLHTEHEVGIPAQGGYNVNRYE